MYAISLFPKAAANAAKCLSHRPNVHGDGTEVSIKQMALRTGQSAARAYAPSLKLAFVAPTLIECLAEAHTPAFFPGPATWCGSHAADSPRGGGMGLGVKHFVAHVPANTAARRIVGNCEWKSSRKPQGFCTLGLPLTWQTCKEHDFCMSASANLYSSFTSTGGSTSIVC